jgi:hypothetical protein
LKTFVIESGWRNLILLIIEGCPLRRWFVGRPEIKNGYFDLLKASGLGVDLDEVVIAAHPPMEDFMDFGKQGWEKRDTYR